MRGWLAILLFAVLNGMKRRGLGEGDGVSEDLDFRKLSGEGIKGLG